MPRENRAFHARRKFVHARKHSQLADIAFDFPSGDHFVDLLERLLSVGLLFSLEALSEQGRRGLGNAATVADEADVFDNVSFHREVELQLIAAQRIVSLREKAGIGQLMEIARLFAMVEDDLLIQIAQLVKHGWLDSPATDGIQAGPR